MSYGATDRGGYEDVGEGVDDSETHPRGIIRRGLSYLRKNHNLTIGLIIGTICFFLLIILGLIEVFSNPANRIGPWKYLITNTHEYDMFMAPAAWQQRNSALASFVSYLSGLNGTSSGTGIHKLQLQLQLSNTTTVIFETKSYDTPQGGYKKNWSTLQILNFIGTQTNWTRVDLKYYSPDYQVPYNSPLQPTQAQQTGSMQLLNQISWYNANYSGPISRFVGQSSVMQVAFSPSFATVYDPHQLFVSVDYFMTPDPGYATVDQVPLGVTNDIFTWQSTWSNSRIGGWPMTVVLSMTYGNYNDASAGIVPPRTVLLQFMITAPLSGLGNWDPNVAGQCIELLNVLSTSTWYCLACS